MTACTTRTATPPMPHASPSPLLEPALRYASVTTQLHRYTLTATPPMLPVSPSAACALVPQYPPTFAYVLVLTTVPPPSLHVPLSAASPSPNRAVSGGEALSGRDGGGGGRSSASRSPGGTGPAGEGAAGGRGAAYDSPAVGGGLISA